MLRFFSSPFFFYIIIIILCDGKQAKGALSEPRRVYT